MNFQKRPIRKNKQKPEPAPLIISRKPIGQRAPKKITTLALEASLEQETSASVRAPAVIESKNVKKIAPDAKTLKPLHQKNLHENLKILAIVLGVLIIGLLGWGTITLVKSIDLTTIIFSAGKNLRTDEYGHTNILLTGIGGKGHDGSNLTDTIILANIDYDHKAVSMLSIPRDLYVKDKRFINGGRINTVFAIGKSNGTTTQGMENLKNIVTNITGVSIQYWIKADFKAFTEIIDSLGGVDVFLEKPIYDTAYPLDEYGHVGTFAMAVGPHHLDGKTALKFARSRHGDGDFARALRQQQLLSAIREKAFSLNVLTDPTKIGNIYSSLSSNIETDFDLKEMIELAHIAKDFGKENIASRVLTDHETNCGGFLYQPPKEQYDGASVFLPTGNNYDTIQFFVKKFFHEPLLAKDQTPIQILNGTKKPIAGKLTNTLNRFCLNVVYYGNAPNRNLSESTLYYKPGPKGEKPPLLTFLQGLLPPMKTQQGIPEMYLDDDKKKNTGFVVELGLDALNTKERTSTIELQDTAKP